MSKFSPNKEIINHFDYLINQVDIDIEKALENYSQDQVLSQLHCFNVTNRNVGNDKFILDLFGSYSQTNRQQSDDLWTESTKVIEYLNHVRMKTIKELQKAQQDSWEDASRFNYLRIEILNESHKEEIRSQLFTDKFYFQIQISSPKPNITWLFSLYTIVTDFYMSSSDIELLEKFTNARETPLNEHIFDEKMVIIGLLLKYLHENIKTLNFPNHLIHVYKQDLANIRRIHFEYKNVKGINLTNSTVDLSKLEELCVINNNNLEEIKIEGLSSLQVLRLHLLSVDRISLKHSNSLIEFCFITYLKLNFELEKHIFNLLKPDMDMFYFCNSTFGFFYNNCKKSLVLESFENENFDFIFNVCNQIQKLEIKNSNSKNICKLLNFHFPKLLYLTITACEITKIEKKLFNQVPILQNLEIKSNKNLGIIDEDAFSNLSQLVYLDLSSNGIESLETSTFYELVNLNYLDLSSNQLKSLDDNMFCRQKKLNTLYLAGNEELSHFPYNDLLKHIKREYLFDNFILFLSFQFFLFFLILLLI